MSTFHFQQFSVLQEQSGMKVCTDATLFGAMMPIRSEDSVLDIGSGTGLLSLMAAQLGAAKVTAVELTEAAYQESIINFANSPWGDQLTAVHQDIQSFSIEHEKQVDLILCNPPFFQSHTQSENQLRQVARHNDQLPYRDIIDIAVKHLTASGRLYLLLPIHAVESVAEQAETVRLHLNQRIDIRGYERNEAKVAALTFQWTKQSAAHQMHTIYSAKNVYSEESEKYLKPFLLRFVD